MMSILTKKLTPKEQGEIPHELFGFVMEKNDKAFILFDEDGYEFFDNDENKVFNFSTIAGIINYAEYRAKQRGYESALCAIRKALGIFN